MVTLIFLFLFLSSCEPEQCIQREDYYLSSKNHEYNILEKAGSRLGSKHSDETKQILSDANKGEKNPMFGRNHNEETKTKISEALAGKPKPKPEGSGKASQQIEVTDIKNNITTSYDSINKAAGALNINQTVIVNYFSRNQTKPYKGKYTFKKVIIIK